MKETLFFNNTLKKWIAIKEANDGTNKTFVAQTKEELEVKR